MADPIVFDPYLDWVDVPEGDNIPPNAKLVSAADLMRYEQFGVAAAARLNEHDVKWDEYATDETFIRNSLTTNANQITNVQNKVDPILLKPAYWGPTKDITNETAHLDTYIANGIYGVTDSTKATTERGFPVPSLAGTLLVYSRANGVINGTTQEFHPVSSISAGRLFYRRINVNNVWQVWRVYAAQRVDTSSGVAVYVWDNANNRDQVVYRSTDARVHVGTTPPADTTMVWVDIT
jgi:hypothetical protein